MIVFDLDGTLADCEHRRHLINPEHYEDMCHKANYKMVNGEVIVDEDNKCKWRYKNNGEPFQIGWKEFFESCDKDKPINHVISVFNSFVDSSNVEGCKSEIFDIQIWSGRCESVRAKTNTWLMMNGIQDLNILKNLKMRPIGDFTSDDILKEKWLDEILSEGKKIDFVFDDRKKVCDMWIRRGIFVFDVSQGKGNF